VSGSPRAPRVADAPRGSRSFRRAEGFTLIEVLVAATLLVVGALATFALLDRGASATGSSLARDRGNAVAQEMIELASGMRYTRAANDLVSTSAPTAVRKAMDPGGSTSAITTEQVGDLFVPRYRWTVTRGGTEYAVTWRACTTSDRVQGVVIQGLQDCARKAACQGDECGEPLDPTQTPSSCGAAGLGLGLLGIGNGDTTGAPIDADNVTVRLQLLNLGPLSLTNLDLCVRQLVGVLGLDGIVSPLCDLLGTSTVLDPVVGLLNGVLGALSSTSEIGLCPKDDVEAEIDDVTSGVASSTHVEVSVRWHDRHTGRDRTIRQTAVVRRGATDGAAS